MPSDAGSLVGRGATEVPASLQLLFVRHLPGPLGVRLRRRYWGRRLASLGENVRIDEGVQIVNPQHVSIGSGCWIASNVLIGAGPPSTEGREIVRRENQSFDGREGEVRIGDHVYLAPGTLVNGHGGVEVGENASLGAGAKVYSSSHHHRGPGEDGSDVRAAAGMRREATDEVGAQALLVAPVVIDREAFVGSNAVVLPGVTMAKAAWLGAGAVARRDLEAGSVHRAPSPEEVGGG